MSLAPGSTLGPYTITAELGHGGMGVVYTAQDPRLDRQVAIKVLTPDLTRDDTAKQRFLQEAQAASALDHPNICTIFEINETDDGRLGVGKHVLTARSGGCCLTAPGATSALGNTFSEGAGFHVDADYADGCRELPESTTTNLAVCGARFGV